VGASGIGLGPQARGLSCWPVSSPTPATVDSALICTFLEPSGGSSWIIAKNGGRYDPVGSRVCYHMVSHFCRNGLGEERRKNRHTLRGCPQSAIRHKFVVDSMRNHACICMTIRFLQEIELKKSPQSRHFQCPRFLLYFFVSRHRALAPHSTCCRPLPRSKYRVL